MTQPDRAAYVRQEVVTEHLRGYKPPSLILNLVAWVALAIAKLVDPTRFSTKPPLAYRAFQAIRHCDCEADAFAAFPGLTAG